MFKPLRTFSPKFKVTAPVNIPQKAYDAKQHPFKMGNAIQFAIKVAPKIPLENQGVHFIQFITRQVPDLMPVELGGLNGKAWYSVEVHYMTDPTLPKWKLDSANPPDPFYETKGAQLLQKNWYAIYDEPDLGLPEERVIGCTFLIYDNMIFREIHWSLQNIYVAEDRKMELHYAIDSRSAKQLPDWALYVLRDGFHTNKTGGIGQLVYDIPAYLDRKLTRDETELIYGMQQSFQLPPKNWITLIDYPGLFKKLEISLAQSPLSIFSQRTSSNINPTPYVLEQGISEKKYEEQRERPTFLLNTAILELTQKGVNIIFNDLDDAKKLQSYLLSIGIVQGGYTHLINEKYPRMIEVRFAEKSDNGDQYVIHLTEKEYNQFTENENAYNELKYKPYSLPILNRIK